MKKLVILLLCLSFAAVLPACGSAGESGNPSSPGIQPASGGDSAPSDSTSQTETADPYTYNISAVGSLDGLFRLDASKQNLRSIANRLNIDGIHSYDGEEFSGHICESKNEAFPINQTDGEKFVIVGGEYRGSNKIKVYNASFIGYSNISEFYRVKLKDTIDFQGVDVSKISNDYEAVNEALSGTGVHFHRCRDNQSQKFIELILADEKDKIVNYSAYYGTQSKTMSVTMSRFCYLVKDETAAFVPIEKTQDGYFIIDTSSLSAGIYVVDSASGWFPFRIQ